MQTEMVYISDERITHNYVEKSNLYEYKMQSNWNKSQEGD